MEAQMPYETYVWRVLREKSALMQPAAVRVSDLQGAHGMIGNTRIVWHDCIVMPVFFAELPLAWIL